MKFLFGKESFLKVFSKDSYDRLKFHISAWLGLNPDYAPIQRWKKQAFVQKLL